MCADEMFTLSMLLIINWSCWYYSLRLSDKITAGDQLKNKQFPSLFLNCSLNSEMLMNSGTVYTPGHCLDYKFHQCYCVLIDSSKVPHQVVCFFFGFNIVLVSESSKRSASIVCNNSVGVCFWFHKSKMSIYPIIKK